MDLGMRRIVSFRVGWLLVGVGLVCAIFAAFVIVGLGPALNDTFLRRPCATPCSEVLDLDAGRYLVFEQVGRSTRVGPVTTTTQGEATISPANVEVTSAVGRSLQISRPGSTQTIERNGTTFRGVASFEVPESGRYLVTVDSPGRTQVLVAPGLGQTLLRALPGVALGGLGALAGGAGVVLLILAWTRRWRASSAA
jgi:hypothetical protein